MSFKNPSTNIVKDFIRTGCNTIISQLINQSINCLERSTVYIVNTAHILLMCQLVESLATGIKITVKWLNLKEMFFLIYYIEKFSHIFIPIVLDFLTRYVFLIKDLCYY